MSESYEACHIKRKRRSREEINELWTAIRLLLQEDNPMTVRQVFYQMAARRAVDKTENGYNLVQRNLAEMRRSGFLKFAWIADNTRWRYKPNTFSSISSMLEDSIALYRRAVWAEQEVYVEVWCEKDALAGVIQRETGPWDVPLMIARGFSSLTYIYNAAKEIEAIGKPAYIYYFGDYDPSGVIIPVTLEAGLRQYAPTTPISFNRVAITPAQIEKYNLPTRPTKKSPHNSHGSLRFGDESVDLDALPSAMLRAMVKDCIVQHINPEIYRRTMENERLERETLRHTFGQFNVA